MLGQLLDALPFSFFDVETTGLIPAHGHRICEIALLRVRGASVEARIDTLINPQRPLDAQAFAIHGIATAQLEHAPLFAEIAETICHALEGTILVAHNAPFDLIFLRHALEEAGHTAPHFLIIDTLLLARRLFQRQSYSLYALAHDLNLPIPNHRAMSDVVALRALFEYMVHHMAAEGRTTLADVLRCQRGLLVDQPEPVPPPPIDRALREGRRLRIVYTSRTTREPTERIVQPIELLQERSGIFLRAYCYLRNDLRSFALNRIEAIELAE